MGRTYRKRAQWSITYWNNVCPDHLLDFVVCALLRQIGSGYALYLARPNYILGYKMYLSCHDIFELLVVLAIVCSCRGSDTVSHQARLYRLSRTVAVSTKGCELIRHVHFVFIVHDLLFALAAAPSDDETDNGKYYNSRNDAHQYVRYSHDTSHQILVQAIIRHICTLALVDTHRFIFQ